MSDCCDKYREISLSSQIAVSLVTITRLASDPWPTHCLCLVPAIVWETVQLCERECIRYKYYISVELYIRNIGYEWYKLSIQMVPRCYDASERWWWWDSCHLSMPRRRLATALNRIGIELSTNFIFAKWTHHANLCMYCESAGRQFQQAEGAPPNIVKTFAKFCWQL